jgi:hypothetical protein
MPLETISGVGRTPNREAGVIPASLESLKTLRKLAGTTRCGGRPSPKSSALEGCGHTSAISSTSKTKGRPWAAEVENTAEDINSSESFQGTPGLESPGGIFAFYSPLEILLHGGKNVKLDLKSLDCAHPPIAYLGTNPPSKPSSNQAQVLHPNA